MRACGGRSAGLRGSARFRALEQRELARAALRITGVLATQPSRIFGGLGSSWPHVSRPALSRAAGRCTVGRHHRVIVSSGTLHPRRRTAIGALIVDRRITQLQTAVNAVRALANYPTLPFAAVAPGGLIHPSHLAELRAALAPARTALGLPDILYTSAPATGGRIWANDMNETRAGVR